MSDEQALKFGRYNPRSNCLATLIPTTILRRVLLLALLKIGLAENCTLQRFSQKRALESIERRYCLYQGPMVRCSKRLHAEQRHRSRNSAHFCLLASLKGDKWT